MTEVEAKFVSVIKSISSKCTAIRAVVLCLISC